jgi:rfaE bifunctional protein nucleotidyltransferase chain/domain
MSHLSQLQNKIITRQAVNGIVQQLKSEGKRIVFTNGCFDILHKGHVQYLALSADYGDVLVLGLNSDDSVKRLGKGDDRPINNFEARSTVIAGLSFVDFVVEFNEDTPFELINEVVPDILVKGGDYEPDESDPTSKKYIVGRDIVLANKGQVKIVNLVDGYSTTNLINQIRK